MNAQYPRDLKGYIGRPPHANWPNQARVAVQFVLNYEEGAENSVLHGDSASEIFLSEIIGAQPLRVVDTCRWSQSMSTVRGQGSGGFWSFSVARGSSDRVRCGDGDGETSRGGRGVFE